MYLVYKCKQCNKNSNQIDLFLQSKFLQISSSFYIRRLGIAMDYERSCKNLWRSSVSIRLDYRTMTGPSLEIVLLKNRCVKVITSDFYLVLYSIKRVEISYAVHIHHVAV